MGINAENTVKEIDLSFVANASGIVIDEGGEGFQQKAVSKNTKLKVTMKPHRFVVKI